MKATEQYFPLINSCGLTIQMKVTEKHLSRFSS